MSTLYVECVMPLGFKPIPATVSKVNIITLQLYMGAKYFFLFTVGINCSWNPQNCITDNLSICASGDSTFSNSHMPS